METKRIPLLGGWLTDIDMSQKRIRSSGMPAFVHADTPSAHATSARFPQCRDATTVENSYPATSQSQQLYKSDSPKRLLRMWAALARVGLAAPRPDRANVRERGSFSRVLATSRTSLLLGVNQKAGGARTEIRLARQTREVRGDSLERRRFSVY